MKLFTLVCGALLVIGIAERYVSPHQVAMYWFPFQRDAFIQLGLIGLVVCSGIWIGRRFAPSRTDRFIEFASSIALRLSIAIALFFAAGELAVRLMFPNGTSFGKHGGPIVRRFEKNFEFNGLDGSRGPRAIGSKKHNAIRFLVQGDSITWGQGVQSEGDLYTSRLLRSLQIQHPAAEMTVLAKGGRGIRDHFDQLVKYGDLVAPDIIIYQWYINDLEITRNRPVAPARLWRHLFFHRVLMETSYFWYFVDYKLNELLPEGAQSLADYRIETYGENTEAWQEFAEAFGRWAVQSKRHTPRVLVVLYPQLHDPNVSRFYRLRERVRRLCDKNGIESIDLLDGIQDLVGKTHLVYATPYDPHPSKIVHHRIAKIIFNDIVVRWSDFFRSSAVKQSVATPVNILATPGGDSRSG